MLARSCHVESEYIKMVNTALKRKKQSLEREKRKKMKTFDEDSFKVDDDLQSYVELFREKHLLDLCMSARPAIKHSSDIQSLKYPLL